MTEHFHISGIDAKTKSFTFTSCNKGCEILRATPEPLGYMFSSTGERIKLFPPKTVWFAEDETDCRPKRKSGCTSGK